MFDDPIDLAKARILLSNDDGAHAPGLKVLERVARSLCKDVWVVAPEEEQSGASHSLTLRRPLRVRKSKAKHYSIDGTPTDCVLLAVKHLMKDARPTLLLSGINAGANLGEDISYSGTVAAAMEATILDVPAVAFSQHYDRSAKPRWPTAEKWAPQVLTRLVASPWPRNTLINVNFPDCPPEAVKGIVVARQGRRVIGDNLHERTDPRGRRYYWIGPTLDRKPPPKETDLSYIEDGYVTVTPIFLDYTHVPALKELKKVFS